MKPVKPIDIIQTGSFKGREAPPDSRTSKRSTTPSFTIETPSLPFETEPLKVRRTNQPKRVQTAYTKVRPRTSKNENQYALRFQDFTWGHTDLETHDHYANRNEIQDVAENFDNAVRSISESSEVETASALQAAADLLLENIESQLRAECREQSELVSRVRISYAHVFMLMATDAQKAREMIKRLEQGNEKLEENLTKIIDNATERVKEAQDECSRQIQNMSKEMDEKKEEYDTSMKRFLEQKVQLEEHVKALHRVFLDFQNDSVYITLEDLKQKQELLEKKLRNKDQEIAKLQTTIAKCNKQIQEENDQRVMLEQANDELRRKLKMAMANANRLQRRIDMQTIDGAAFEFLGEDEDENETDANSNKTNAETNTSDKPNSSKTPTKKKKIDFSPILQLHQKLTKIGDRMVDALQRTNSATMYLSDSNSDNLDKLILSGESRLMMRALETKIDDLVRISDYLESIEINGSITGGVSLSSIPTGMTSQVKLSIANLPRFLCYIKASNDKKEVQSTDQPSTSESISSNPSESKLSIDLEQRAFQMIRQIFQAKYISDQWRERMGQPLMRFPEFVIAYYAKDKESIFLILQRCTRLWNAIRGQKNPEIKLFRKFLLEKYTVDELSFFLELRMSLIGLPPVSGSEEKVLSVTVQKCKDTISRIFGNFSPIAATIIQETEKLAGSNEYIDYAQFSRILIEYYQRERRKRRNAVRLMFQSRRFSTADGQIDFENFHAMIQSLGYQGSIEDVFQLYRESSLVGSGFVTLDSLLVAMDNLSFHFYTIDLPARLNKMPDLTSMTRKDLLIHWKHFSLWFDVFTKLRTNFDTWARSKLIAKINTVDRLFKNNAPLPNLFCEYRALLDHFQFLLDVMAKGKSYVMGEHKAEKELSILENLIDLLVSFIVDPESPGKVEFHEFE